MESNEESKHVDTGEIQEMGFAVKGYANVVCVCTSYCMCS